MADREYEDRAERQFRLVAEEVASWPTWMRELYLSLPKEVSDDE